LLSEDEAAHNQKWPRPVKLSRRRSAGSREGRGGEWRAPESQARRGPAKTAPGRDAYAEPRQKHAARASFARAGLDVSQRALGGAGLGGRMPGRPIGQQRSRKLASRAAAMSMYKNRGCGREPNARSVRQLRRHSVVRSTPTYESAAIRAPFILRHRKPASGIRPHPRPRVSGGPLAASQYHNLWLLCQSLKLQTGTIMIIGCGLGSCQKIAR
jgi:hypothetical protein